MYGQVSVNETTGTITYDHAGECTVDTGELEPHHYGIVFQRE